MKIKILLLTLGIFLTVQLTAQQSWRKQRSNALAKQQNTLEKKYPFLANKVANSRSSMEGEVWNKIAGDAIPLEQEVNSLKMVDENIIWMTSSAFLFGPPSEGNANVHQSLDGGLTWTTLSIPNTPGFFAVDIAPINANIAYVTLWGPNYFNDSSMDAIYKTVDGGQTWGKVENFPFSPSYVHFYNELEGWVMGGDEVFVTISVTNDGGQTWNHAGGDEWDVPEGRSLPPQNENEFVGTFLYSISSNYEVLDSTIIIGGTNYWISHDRGYNWTVLNSPLAETDGLLHGTIAMKDTETYMFASNLDLEFFFVSPVAYTTTDGGQTWIKSIPPVNPSAAEYLHGTNHDFIITGQDQGFGVGNTGTARTNDLENWEIVDDKGLLSTCFIGENKGIGAFANYPGIIEAGNVYNWAPKVVLEYDALIARTNDFPFTIITLNHLPEELVFDYQIQNLGINDLDNTTLIMEILLNGEIIGTHSEEITINQGLTESIAFFYTPTQIGVYEFKISANQANIGAAFFKDTRRLEVSETTLAKDNGVWGVSFGIDPDSPGNTHGYFGSEFTLLKTDRLASFSVVVLESFADSTGLYNFIIKAIGDNGVVEEGEIYRLEQLPIKNVFNDLAYSTIELPESIELPSGRYIFAVGQDEPQAFINFGFETKPDPGAWFYSLFETGGPNASWINASDGSLPTLMLRPNFEPQMSTSTQETSLTENTSLLVFPVPFKDELNILLEYTNEQEVTIQIFDLAGKQWSNFTTSHQQLINQNLSNLPNGLYLLKLQSGLYQRSVKVLKQ